MSGGSYNYLCKVYDPEDIFSHMGDLRAMADRLAGLGYAQDAAAETEDLICMINQARIRIATRMDRLREVWHDVEWWDSGDNGEDQLKQELVKYRGETPAPPPVGSGG
jgi:hypothetical protein